ncbi:MAG: ATPase [Deltaproteobacteria bacterium]|nr:MAG: ATPase [Deltaproteobacteria bacterium]
MSFYCGVDIGSTWTKAVILGEEEKSDYTRALVRTGISFEAAALSARDEALARAKLAPEDITRTFSTGYGRMNAEFADGRRTEIACHAKGAFHSFPHPCHVVDIGGQDNKIIQLNASGAVEHFLMNRKCAAGTGSFIEEISRRLDIDMKRLEELAENATKEITLSSFCTVFSATEVIKLIREGENPENIAKGVFNAVVARVTEMGTLGGKVVLTGGVAAAFPIVAQILSKATGQEVFIPEHAQFTGALGAALEAKTSS